MGSINWHALFIPDLPPVEIFLRGTLIYLGLLCLLRLVLKRQAGAIGMTDLLVIVLLADATQNGMAGDYKSVPDGLMLAATIIFWNVALEWLGYHVPLVERFISPPPLPLVERGKMLPRNMRSEFITEDELLTQLRLQGVENLKEVKRACLEGDGKISVITFRKRASKRQESKIS